jgi:hypothetical protein
MAVRKRLSAGLARERQFEDTLDPFDLFASAIPKETRHPILVGVSE